MAIATTEQTRDVLDGYLQATREGIDAVLEHFADDAVVFTQGGAIHGRAGIRNFMEQFRSNMPPDILDRVEFLREEVDGDIAYLVWKAEPYVAFATDTYVVRDGKIMTHTLAAYTLG